MFTRGLVADLIVDGNPWDVRLVDIDEANLEVARRLVERMIQAKDAPITVQHCTDRREVLDGSDVVVTTIAVGGRRAWETDVLIPRQFGIFQPVGDTIMPGGIFRALRLIPAMVEIAQDVARYAPQAAFFNYSNPMSAICRGVRKATSVPVVGLCHGVPEVERYLARFVKTSLERCRFVAAGINHLTWFFEFTVDGEDAWPLVRSRCAELARPDAPLGGDPGNPLSWELFHAFGAFPAVLDRHVAEFLPQFHRNGAYYGRTLGVDAFSFENTIEHGDKAFADMADQAYGRKPLDKSVLDRTVGEHEQLVCILNALEKEDGGRFSVILPNAGQVRNLPPDLAIECPAHVSRSGIEPVPLGDLPTGLRAPVEKALLTVELAVEAALERDRKKLIQTLVVDGSVTSVSQANALADAMLEAHKPYLPDWASA